MDHKYYILISVCRINQEAPFRPTISATGSLLSHSYKDCEKFRKQEMGENGEFSISSQPFPHSTWPVLYGVSEFSEVRRYGKSGSNLSHNSRPSSLRFV